MNYELLHNILGTASALEEGDLGGCLLVEEGVRENLYDSKLTHGELCGEEVLLVVEDANLCTRGNIIIVFLIWTSPSRGLGDFSPNPSKSGIEFLPALHCQWLVLILAECFDECLGEADIGHERNVVVDGAATYAVAIGELALGTVLRNVDD